MATTDSNGILFYEVTDALSPLQVLLNAGQQSVSDALGATARIFPVANVAARTALAASASPSASTPLYVFRADAAVGAQLEYTIDGTTWRSVDTSGGTWTTMTASAGWASYGSVVASAGFDLPAYRLRNGMVEIVGGWLGRTSSTSVTAGTPYTTVVSALPVGYRPSTTQVVLGAINVNSAASYCQWRIGTDGTVTWIPMASGTLTATGATFAAMPPITFPAV